MIIKICGMRDPDNIRAVESLGPDWLGFIFWPHSSRYVAECPAYLPEKAKRVGVFVDAELDFVCRTAAEYGFDLIQLHGHESPDYLRSLRHICHDNIVTPASVSTSYPALIKTFCIATAADLRQTADYEGLADYFLFDTKGPSVGGNGLQFDWSVLSAYHGATPFLLSGGIGPNDAAKIAAFSHPRCIGIDVNSRFETTPALKDISKLKTFLNRLGMLRKP